MSGATSILSKWEDSALVEALRNGHPAAKAEFFDRYARHVERILVRILGHERDLADLLHEVFARALAAHGTLRDPRALKPWLTGVAALTAREFIRRRARGRWLHFFADEALPEVESVPADEDAREALRATYAVLDRLGADERVAFALRYFEGMELTAVAAACDVSLNTIKRRLDRAERRFLALAEREPALESWLPERTRWKRK
jgi:RNA polymerase sigma-70 factor (ECF subfamily)